MSGDYKRQFNVWFVGVDEDDAVRTALPFDSYESAESYLLDNPGMKMFTGIATLDASTIIEEDV